jgi:hypothetical protein
MPLSLSRKLLSTPLILKSNFYPELLALRLRMRQTLENFLVFLHSRMRRLGSQMILDISLLNQSISPRHLNHSPHRL